jgi:rfaE bifunctional protein nucleotidyltransferase chain/domain
MKRQIIDPNELAEVSREMKARGQRLVFTNGCFDLLHLGHVRYLAAARALGDALAVGINGDASVRSLKGVDRPINREQDRAEVVAALESVDYVTIFTDVRTTNLLRLVRPHVYVKGGDYTPETLNTDEKAVLDEIGAEINIVPFTAGYSTTELINRLVGKTSR